MAEMKDLHVLSTEDRQKLKDQPSRRYPTGKRNAAIIAVLDRCGLRVSEALALALKDYNPRRGELRIRKSKRDKNRTSTASPMSPLDAKICAVRAYTGRFGISPVPACVGIF